MNSLPNGLTILLENGVGRCALYTQYGERISFDRYRQMQIEWRVANLMYLTGIRLAGFGSYGRQR